MHLANNPVVSTESKKPKALTSGFSNFCCSVRFNVPSLTQFKHFLRLSYGHAWTPAVEQALATLGRLAHELAERGTTLELVP